MPDTASNVIVTTADDDDQNDDDDDQHFDDDHHHFDDDDQYFDDDYDQHDHDDDDDQHFDDGDYQHDDDVGEADHFYDDVDNNDKSLEYSNIKRRKLFTKEWTMENMISSDYSCSEQGYFMQKHQNLNHFDDDLEAMCWLVLLVNPCGHIYYMIWK